MKNRIALLLFVFAFASCQYESRTQVIWQIGTRDGRATEFALSPERYQDFLQYDFGWEDRFYLIGHSTPGADWPFILPGPANRWGGTSETAGWRTHVLNVLFGMETVPKDGCWKLTVDVLNADSIQPPLFKVSVNGQGWKYAVPEGSGNMAERPGDSVLLAVEIRLPAELIHEGGNEINFTVLEGSWLTFDGIRLEGPERACLQAVHPAAFVRGVQAAGYSLTDGNVQAAQPLLTDVECLSGNALLHVSLDGSTILEQTIEKGRYVLEAPMPAVSAPVESAYAVCIGERTIARGKVMRSPQPPVTPADYVNTLMGTAHSRWMIAPGPWMPFSMVKLSPDNQNGGWQAGYQPSFESVGVFSHIHEWTMGGLGMLPVTGVLKTRIGDQSERLKSDAGYRSAIDKATEEAPLGYYKVHLTDYDITAELTATTRCGFQRYTCPKGSQARVLIDLKIPAEYDYEILEAQMQQVSAGRVEGFCKQQSKHVWSHDADQDYTVYFVIEFDHDITRFGGWTDHTLSDSCLIRGVHLKQAGCYAEFDTQADSTVQVRSAISYVDMEGARRNLETEVIRPFGWDFEAVRRYQRDVWNDLLGRIRIRSVDRREKVRFYTNLYRSFCRNTFSDTDGRWRDATEQIRQLADPDAVALGCDAFWNTFWNLNQVWNLIAPEWSSRWVKSQLAMYDACGWLAKGPAGMEYIPVMVGEHEIPLMAGAYQMGIRDYDAEKMFEAVKKMQTTPPARPGGGFAGNRDLDAYLRYHYVPADKGRFSNTLEYAYDDWAVSQLAKALGKEDEYARFAGRGAWWRNAIEPDSGYAHLRYADGRWEQPFDPFTSGANRHYVEGNAWQLTFFVPQDVPALVEAVGRQRFIDRLTWGFEASEPWRYNAPGDRYWDFPVVQGNQQSMHFAFLFNWAGQPWQTQRWSRSIIDRYYGFDIANACLGDEDQGQMSAWFVMAALGLFQTDGGCSTEPVYEIASPLFEKVEIDLGRRYGRGTVFTIEAEGASRTRLYVQSATLNGRPLHSFKFPAKELLKGGSLKLKMGASPHTTWGTGK
ncbi:MAG: GH92 family glycosyl hydrolase [Tannerella sp.]|jgi:predicted alpha-1,2-mannosidase|nr:GH92 family glycosyl hydrolase [Tannerella sp.]